MARSILLFSITLLSSALCSQDALNPLAKRSFKGEPFIRMHTFLHEDTWPFDYGFAGRTNHDPDIIAAQYGFEKSWEEKSSERKWVDGDYRTRGYHTIETWGPKQNIDHSFSWFEIIQSDTWPFYRWSRSGLEIEQLKSATSTTNRDGSGKIHRASGKIYICRLGKDFDRLDARSAASEGSIFVFGSRRGSWLAIGCDEVLTDKKQPRVIYFFNDKNQLSQVWRIGEFCRIGPDGSYSHTSSILLEKMSYAWEEGRIVQSEYWFETESHPQEGRSSGETHRFEYAYNEKGMLKERLRFSENSFFPEEKKTIQYDDWGNPTTITIAGSDGKVDWHYTLDYELDEFNRWTRIDAKPDPALNRSSPTETDVGYYESYYQIGRQIRYRGDTRPLSVFISASSNESTGRTKASAKKPVWTQNLSQLKRSAQSKVVIKSSGASCLGSQKEHDEGRLILETVLAPHFTILERQRLNDVIDEQALGMSGLFDEAEVVEAGKLLGANGVITLSFGCVDLGRRIECRYVDTLTGEVIWSVIGHNADMASLIDLLNKALYR